MNTHHSHCWTLIAQVPVHHPSLDLSTALGTGHQLMTTLQAMRLTVFPQHFLIAASGRVWTIHKHISTLSSTMSLKPLQGPSPLAAAAAAITSGGVGALHLQLTDHVRHN
eukprot:CAMPEP_0114441354 /NCGR_PEP_ID=MMETSP0103-20121206/16324_1 /TAXON_ID=37642 ORGANISM="Paraphysomonas imperforata, Strain PA2" /NCGR_SAMPLE_ID=MMETSP0103 /ASSEMBLY_ACC=CAM_ASM_000201 /LENGTH=109 /DNA_ID=CAMNT_0001612451 /DNA_START=526 /DNA_END=855 /DNA_ORIENTATION=-